MTESTRHTFEADGRAISYVDEGTGPGLVLLPGRGLDIAYLEILALDLVELGFRILRIGSRRASDDDVTLHDLAQDVVDVMDHVDLADAWIGGHAFGGIVARMVALDHLDRVGGVLLLSVEAPGRAPEETDAAALQGANADVARMQESALAATPESEWTPIAAVPVLAVSGVDDEVTPVTNGDALREAAPQFVSVYRIEGAGHLFPLTHPGQTAMFIEDFLGWD